MKKITPILITPIITALAGSLYFDTDSMDAEVDFSDLPTNQTVPHLHHDFYADELAKLTQLDPRAILSEKLRKI